MRRPENCRTEAGPRGLNLCPPNVHICICLVASISLQASQGRGHRLRATGNKSSAVDSFPNSVQWQIDSELATEMSQQTEESELCCNAPWEYPFLIQGNAGWHFQYFQYTSKVSYSSRQRKLSHVGQE